MKHRLMMWTVGLLAAVALLAVGLYLHGHHHFNANSTTSGIAATQTIYHYQTLESYKLVSGSGSMSFDKPAEFKVYGSPKAGDSQVLLIQMSSNRTVPDVGRIAAAAVKFPPASALPNNFGASLTGTDKTKYDQALKDLRDFINGRLPFSYSVSSFSGFQSFSNPGVVANAWQSGFTASSNKNGLPKISGEFITAFGKQAQYYFMVDNVQADWSANQAQWQKVTDSLKIDQ